MCTTNSVFKEAVLDPKARGQLLIEVDNFKGLTITSRSVTDQQVPINMILVGNTLKPDTEPCDVAVVPRGSREARPTLRQSISILRAHSPATGILTEQSSTTTLFPGTTIPGFDELVTHDRGDETKSGYIGGRDDC